MNHPSILAIRNAQRYAPEQLNFHRTNMVLVEERLKYMNTRKTCGYNTGLEIATDMVANATNMFSLVT